MAPAGMLVPIPQSQGRSPMTDSTEIMMALALKIVNFASAESEHDAAAKSGACRIAAEAFQQEVARQAILASVWKVLDK